MVEEDITFICIVLSMIVLTSPTLLLHSRNLITLSNFLSVTCPFPVVPSLNRSLTNVNSMHPKEGMIHAIPALAVRLFDALHFFIDCINLLFNILVLCVNVLLEMSHIYFASYPSQSQ